MPLQNRVTPAGEIIRSTHRGGMMGNRGGRFHTADRELTARRWQSQQWICCVLEFKGRRRPVMAPNQYTELFFLDEATALSAGHRPCFECRRADAIRFATIWNQVRALPGRATAGDMDRQLQLERGSLRGVSRHRDGGNRVWRAPLRDLPGGTFIRAGTATTPLTYLVCAGQLYPWSASGYGQAWRAGANAPATAVSATAGGNGRDEVDVLTPRSIVNIFSQGYVPDVHSSCCGALP
jgi:hypothetical protein